MSADQLLDLSRFWKNCSLGMPAFWESSDFSPSPDDLDSFLLTEPLTIERLEKLRTRSCLFLLGRPGAGKTTEFRRHFRPENFPGERLVRFEIRELDSSRMAAIFESPDWHAARNSGRPVRLVLDAVDEALFREPNFFEVLKRRAASEMAIKEFSLVLTCRLAEWDESAAGEIAALWHCKVADCAFELLPLSEAAASILAVEHGVKDGRALLLACQQRQMTGYACWPRTLIWLAREFATGGDISSSLTDLHERRCKRHFEDNVGEALPRHMRTQLMPGRVPIWKDAVELIAAAGLATGIQRFRYDGKASAIAAGELNVRDLAVALERLPANLEIGAFARDSIAFEEALRFGLFQSVGGVHVFQEQSDMEFLAALRLRRLPVEQLIEFFGRWRDGKWRIVPQLATAAAALAGFDEEPCRAFRRHLLCHDPLVLLRTDFARVPDSERAEVVTALLKDTDREGAEDRAESQAQLATLKHSHLADQLKGWLHNHTASRDARDLALRIGIETNCTELAEDIWDLVMAGEEYRLAWLARAVGLLCFSWPKERFLRLARHEAPSDPAWSVAGYALRALFSPSCPAEKGATLQEIVPILEPNPTGIISAYDRFLRDTAEYMHADEPAEIIAVIQRLRDWPGALDSVSPVEELAKAILSAAIRLLPRADVAEAFAGWWIASMRNHEFHMPGQDSGESLAETGLTDAGRRQALLDAILRHPDAAKLVDVEVHWLPSEAADFVWLLKRLHWAGSHNARLTAGLVRRWISDCELRQQHLDDLEKAYTASGALRELLPSADSDGIHATLCRLEDSDRDRRERESVELLLKRERGHREPIYDADEALRAALASFSGGSTTRWPEIVVALSQPGPHAHDGRILDAVSVEDLSGWNRQSGEVQATIRLAARAFLLHHLPPLPPSRQMNLALHSTVLALTLWLDQFESDADLRKRFSPVWVEAVLRTLYPSREPLPELLRVLHHIEPALTLKVCLADLERTWSENSSLVAEHLDGIWSPALRDGVAALLRKTPLQSETYASGLTWLATRERAFAANLALERLHEHAAALVSEARRAAIASCLFLFPEHWQAAWPPMIADPAEGTRLILGVVNSYRWRLWKENFRREAREVPKLLAELHTWTIQREPKRKTAGSSSDFQIMGEPDSLDWNELRNMCHTILQELGQTELLRKSYERSEVVDQEWARRSLRRSVRSADAREWQPWPLDTFVRFLLTEGGTRVTDNDSLLRAIVASLRRFERSWKDMPTHLLWNAERTEPLGEKEFRDTLLHHFRRDLPRTLLLVREATFFTDERDDIRVEAMLSDGTRASIVIEVKQCGHPKVESAIDTQLANRYLTAKGRTHGLYVVGWFAGERWPKKKHRRFQNRGIGNAQVFLNEKASHLRNDGLSVVAVVLDCRITFGCPARTKKDAIRREKSRS